MIRLIDEYTKPTSRQGSVVLVKVYINDGVNGLYHVPGLPESTYLCNNETIAIEKRLELG